MVIRKARVNRKPAAARTAVRETGSAKKAAKKKAPATGSGGRKGASKKKTGTSGKKAEAKKKAVARRKTATKKKAVARKKTATKKKTVARKKTTTKKKAVARKKTITKKKAVARRKTATKKRASRRTSGSPATSTAREPSVRTPPTEGALAPDFSLLADDGREVCLSDYRGQAVVLYFYPRDNTPGCTVEARGFRDHHQDLVDQGAVVFGVSRDSVRTHLGFRQKHDLPFALLSDPDGEVISAYGSWGPKKFMGREFNGILRQTFLIDAQGRIAKHYPKVTPKTHAAEVVADLEEVD